MPALTTVASIATDSRSAGTTGLRDARAGRFAGARILIVGCGDVGLRLVALLGDRCRIFATTSSAERAARLRRAGATPLIVDLDDPRTTDRVRGLAPTVVHLAPPPPHGARDTRTRALLRALGSVERLIYVSTSGVYGDCGGAWVDETRAVAPATDRARRRVDAERCLRAWASDRGVQLTILRVPGIYAADRLPTSRISDGTPVLVPADDVYTNHVHADDLARLIALAIHRGAPQRIYHAVDDSAIKMGEWFDRIADAGRLPRPPRLPRAELEARVGPMRMSFMRESRRLSNRRARDELGFRPRYPTVADGLATLE